MTAQAPGDERGINVVLFAGGRGSAQIARSLSSYPSVRLRVLVNAYDDGLSTGVVRQMFPGMLGPSDIRKNFSNLLRARDRSGIAIAEILDARTSTDLDSDQAVSLLRDLAGGIADLTGGAVDASRHLARGEEQFAQASMDAALDHLSSGSVVPPDGWLAGMALGNLIFAGTYLRMNQSFNDAVAAWNREFACAAEVHNVTDGTSLTLVGVKEDGTYLPDEAAVVGEQSDVRIDSLFLLPTRLTADEAAAFEPLAGAAKVAFLAARQCLPEPNPSLAETIADADLIVYGPGTQHSSLLPTYLTQGLAEEIARRRCEKVFVSNLADDHDIKGETLDSLLAKVGKFMSIGAGRQVPLPDLVTRVIAGERDGSILPWGVRLGGSQAELSPSLVHLGKWGDETSGHFGDRVSRGLMTFVSSTASDIKVPRLTSLSVVMPLLDEATRVGGALTNLLSHDWLGSGFSLEVLVVDGGSTDNGDLVALEYPGVRLIRCDRGTGRGSAIRTGLLASGGDVVVTFPSDGEYDVSGLADVALLASERPDAMVFGNRAALCLDTDARLREIYGGRSWAYFASKYGGFALSLACATLHKRWVADPLTSIKGFGRPLLTTLSLRGSGVDWDLNLVVDARRLGVPVLEIPVAYEPRTYAEGKKIRTSDGLKALAGTVGGRWSNT